MTRFFLIAIGVVAAHAILERRRRHAHARNFVSHEWLVEELTKRNRYPVSQSK
jgi:hypothetical protein